MTLRSPSTIERFVIANAGSTSGAVNLQGGGIKRLLLPATLQGTHLVFQHGEAADAMLDAYDDSNVLIAIPFTQGRAIELNSLLFDGARLMKVRTCSNSTGTAQTQSAARTIGAVVV